MNRQKTEQEWMEERCESQGHEWVGAVTIMLYVYRVCNGAGKPNTANHLTFQHLNISIQIVRE